MRPERFDELRTAPFDELRTAPFDELRTAPVHARLPARAPPWMA
jgi:hypothetical protein